MTDDRVFVEFKSTPENYAKESTDLKNNTVRQLQPGEERFLTLDVWATLLKFQGMEPSPPLWIRIVETTTQKYIERKVRDVTFWNGLTIITWHEEAKGGDRA